MLYKKKKINKSWLLIKRLFNFAPYLVFYELQ